MTVAGEGRSPARRHLLELATAGSIPDHDAEAILDEVATTVGRWRTHARRVGVRRKTAEAIEQALGLCLARMI